MACQANYDARASVEPIEALLALGCDLEADVLPTVARMVPELPRPLKNWGAQWLVREIMAAPDQRLALATWKPGEGYGCGYRPTAVPQCLQWCPDGGPLCNGGRSKPSEVPVPQRK
jgi:hypothetical protein